MKKFKENEIKKIIDMYLETKDIEKMMDVFECDEHDLRVVLKENKVDRGSKYSEELSRRIVILYQKNDMYPKDIIFNLLISEKGLKYHLDKAGIQRKGRKKYKRNSHYFDEINTPNKAYVLGLIYADGCNYTKKHQMIIGLQERDKYILELIKEDMEYEGPILYSPIRENDKRTMGTSTLQICDKQISRQLEEKGVTQAKTFKIKFPEFISSDLIRHFVRGYFDGDGSIYIEHQKNGNYHYRATIVGTKDICEKISAILNSIGCNNNILKHPNSNVYVLKTSGNPSTYTFTHWMYNNSDFKLERKYDRYLDLCRLYPKSHINLNQSNELIK